MNTQVSQEPLDWVILQVAVPAMHLQTVIDDVPALVSSELLGHRAVHRVVRVLGHNQARTMPHHQARGFQVRRHPRQLELHVLVRGDWSAELLSTLDVVRGGVEARSSATKGTAGDVEATAIEAR